MHKHTAQAIKASLLLPIIALAHFIFKGLFEYIFVFLYIFLAAIILRPIIAKIRLNKAKTLIQHEHYITIIDGIKTSYENIDAKGFTISSYRVIKIDNSEKCVYLKVLRN